MKDAAPPIPPFLTPAGRAEELIPTVLALLVVYLIGGVVAFPLSIWPLDVVDVSWRERAGEVYLMTMPPLVFTIVIMLIAGVYAGQHRSVRIGGVVLLVLAALTTLMLPFFFLDFLSVRHLQQQEALDAFTRNALRLGATGALLVPFLIFAGRKAWFAGRPQPGAELGQGHGLVVGQEP